MNIVFDFGGVLFNWKPLDLLQQQFPQHAPNEARAREVAAAIFQAHDPAGDWAEFDRGTADAEVLVPRIAQRTGLPPEMLHALIAAIPPHLVPQADTVAFLHRLKAEDHRLLFLSNMPAPFAAHLEVSHDFLGLFDDGIFSAHIGLIKPEREIFVEAQRRFDIRPEDTVFFDDYLFNIDAARAEGWHAIHFQHAAQAEAEFRALLLG
jgi:putative hydrolase of the HAD superfamily